MKVGQSQTATKDARAVSTNHVLPGSNEKCGMRAGCSSGARTALSTHERLDAGAQCARIVGSWLVDFQITDARMRADSRRDVFMTCVIR